MARLPSLKLPGVIASRVVVRLQSDADVGVRRRDALDREHPRRVGARGGVDGAAAADSVFLVGLSPVLGSDAHLARVVGEIRLLAHVGDPDLRS